MDGLEWSTDPVSQPGTALIGLAVITTTLTERQDGLPAQSSPVSNPPLILQSQTPSK